MTTEPKLVLVEFVPSQIEGQDSYSPFVTKVIRALNFAGLTYTVQYAANPNDLEKYNPKKQVPILLVDEKPVYDSTVILKKIDQLAGIKLAGPTKEIAAEARLWEEFADGAFYGYMVAARWADDENWPKTKDAYFYQIPALIRRPICAKIRADVMKSLIGRDIWRGGAEECWNRLYQLFDDLDIRAPQNGYWLGDQLTTADIALFSQLHCIRTDMTKAQYEEIKKRKNLIKWVNRVDEATRLRQPNPL